MKKDIFSFKYIVLTLVASLTIQNFVSAQGTDARSNLSKLKRMYVGVTINPMQSNITLGDISDITGILSQGKLTFNGCMDFGYFFTSFAGISVGVGYKGFSQELTLDAYQTSFAEVDTENESYEMQIQGETISEEQNLAFFCIPVCLNFRVQVFNKTGIFLSGGAEFLVPLSNSYDASGIFTYQGYYAAYPVLLQGLPQYGFPNDLNTSTTGELNIKPLNIALTVSGGIARSFGEKFQLVLSVNYCKSLSDISDYESSSSFKLTSKANELNSLMEGSSKAELQGIGFGIGLKYFLK